MKKTVKLAMIGIIMAAGVGNLSAQSNVVRNLKIALSAAVQSGETGAQNMKASNKEVLTAIGTDVEGGVAANAKLLIATPIEGEGFSVIARSKGVEDVDVTSFFSESQIGTSVVSGTSEISIREFVFHSSTLNFDVQGYTTSKNVNVKNAGTSKQENASVAGTGDVNGSAAVYKGTVNVTGPKVE